MSSLDKNLKKTDKIDEIRLKGDGISPGISVGTPWIAPTTVTSIPEHYLDDEDLTNEITRFHSAVNKTKSEIQSLKEKIEKDNQLEGYQLLEAQLQMMEDPMLTTEMEKQITQKKRNAEWLLIEFLEEYRRYFKMKGDLFFADRFKDYEDICNRIIHALLRKERSQKSHPSKRAIIISNHLSTSDAAELQSFHVSGFVTHEGGVTSHSTIIAKAHGIPYVTAVNIQGVDFNKVEKVIIDGYHGYVVLNPREETLHKYRLIKRRLSREQKKLDEQVAYTTETFDGHKIKLTANLEMESEIDILNRFQSHGVGLYRSEYLYFTNNRFPDEEEQYQVYCAILKKMQGLPVVIRVFDVGGDKKTAHLSEVEETNPYLGYRAIRFLLKEKLIFTTQLRAILRASEHGEVRLMLPMVSGIQEILDAKKLLKDTVKTLEKEGYTVPKKIPIGCMIEVPSAAIISDLIAKECDFLSIGTNDLVQYTLAVDRGNTAMSSHYTPTHPGVLRLIKIIVAQASQHNTPVNVCGEIASDPYYTPLLLGLGVHELSVAAPYIPIVNNSVRHTSIVRAHQLAHSALTLTTAEEVMALLEEEYRHRIPEPLVATETGPILA